MVVTSLCILTTYLEGCNSKAKQQCLLQHIQLESSERMIACVSGTNVHRKSPLVLLYILKVLSECRDALEFLPVLLDLPAYAETGMALSLKSSRRIDRNPADVARRFPTNFAEFTWKDDSRRNITHISTQPTT